MSVGFLFTATIPDQNAFLQVLRNTAERCGYSYYGQENWATVNLCRMGDMAFRFEQQETLPDRGIQLTADSNTALAGAGFHAAAMEFTDELIRESQLEIRMEDETGYFENRDFEQMRQKHFYSWLGQLVTICRGQHHDQNVSTLMLCWDIDQYHPREIEGSIVTPFGRFSLNRTLELIEKRGIEAFAEQFFTWNDREKNAKYYRNQALTAMWEQCHFMPGTRSEQDFNLNAHIIGYIERSAGMDPDIPLPKEEYQLLCSLQNQTPMDLSGHPDFKSDYPIGYLRDDITQRIGNMDVVIPGYFLYDPDEDGMLWYGGEDENWKNLRISAFRTSGDAAEFSPTLFQKCTGTVEEFPAGEGRGRAAYAGSVTDADGSVFHQSIAQILCREQVMLITASHQCKADADWAINLFRQIKGRKD